MKKFIALAIAVVMLAALAVPAFAATQTEVKYTVNGSYDISVPPTVIIPTEGDSVESTVTVTNINVLKNQKVVVTLDTNNGTLTDADEEFVVAGAFAVNVSSIEFLEGEDGPKTFNVTKTESTPTQAGNYVGAITFTAGIQ